MSDPTGATRTAVRPGADRVDRLGRALARLAVEGLTASLAAGCAASGTAIESMARGAMARRATVVFMGELKAGKTSVVNALLGQPVLSTDLLRATEVPVWVSYGAEPGCEVVVLDGRHRRLARVAVELGRLEDLVQDPQARLGEDRVDHLRVAWPHPILRHGLVLVDTPGTTGGLSSRTAATVVQLLHQADVAVLVTDAGQELSASELAMLAQAQAHCPLSLVVMTRADLYADWPRIRARNLVHVASLDQPVPVLAVGIGLQHLAARLGDRAIERESGVPFLWRHLAATALPALRSRWMLEAIVRMRGELREVGGIVRRRLDVASGDMSSEDLEARLNDAERQLDELSQSWRIELRAAERNARTRAGRNLDDRLKGARDDLRLDLAQLSSADEWPLIEGAAVAAATQLFSDQLRIVDAEVGRLVDRLVERLGVDRMALTDVPASEAPPLHGAPAQPDIDRSQQLIQRSYVALRSVRVGGSVGLTSVVTLVHLGVLPLAVAAPVVGAVAGAGGWIGVKLLDRLQQRQQTEGWRLRAGREIDVYLDAMATEIRRHTADMFDSLADWLEATVPQLVRARAEQINAERKRLVEMVAHRATAPPDTGSADRELLERIQLVDAHLERLEHQLHRPEIEALWR